MCYKFYYFLVIQNDAATLTLLKCNALKFNAAYGSLALAFIFYLAEVVCWIK